MKKIVSLMLVVCLCACFCTGLSACNSGQTNSKTKFNFRSVNIGDTITFGLYEQNNIEDDGTEPIEWLVLAKEGNKLLVISKYLIDIYPYNSSEISVTWEDCTLRAWLNSTFYEDAFSIDERKIITDTEVFTKGAHQKFYSSLLGGYTLTAEPMKDCITSDKIFILSVDELELYFDDDNATITKPTTYARLATRGEHNIPDEWFTRTPGVVVGAQKFMDDNGFSLSGGAMNPLCLGVRPCMWIEISN